MNARKGERGTARWLALGTVALLAAAAAPPLVLDGMNGLTHAPLVLERAAAAHAGPCDVPGTGAGLRALVNAGLHGTARHAGRAFLARCGDETGILWWMKDIDHALGDDVAALDDLDRAVALFEKEPSRWGDMRPWLAREKLRRQLGDAAGADEDVEQAMTMPHVEVSPGPPAQVEVARAWKAAGRACDGLALLGFARELAPVKKLKGMEDAIGAELRRFSDDGVPAACGFPGAEGTVEIQVAGPAGRTTLDREAFLGALPAVPVVLEATVDGKPLRLGLWSTGRFSALKADAARALGWPAAGRVLRTRMAGVPLMLRRARPADVTVGGLVVRGAQFTVLEDAAPLEKLAPGLDGALGADVLARLDLAWRDEDGGRLVIRPRADH